MIPEDQDPSNNLRMSTAIRPQKLLEALNQNQPANEIALQPVQVEYKEMDQNGSIEDIDDELTFLEQNEDPESEIENEIERGIPQSPKEDLITKKSIEISQKVVKRKEENIDSKAQEIVEQMKNILLEQFKGNMKNESQTHYGIRCSECKASPIIGVRYKCAICIEYNLCEVCEINNTHEHIFIKVKERENRIPMLCEIKHMVKNLPKKEIKPEIKPNNKFPCLALDIS